MEDANKISSIVSKTLYFTDQGISSKISNMHKNMIISQSTLFTAVHEKFKIHYGGSYAEGTYSSGSDIDRMMVIPNILVISNGNERNDRIGHIFQRDPRKCRAGFFTLVLQQLQRLENDLFLPYGKDINDMLEKDNAGNSFLSSDKMSHFSVTQSQRFAPSTYEHSKHGPATNYTEQYAHGFMKARTFTLIDVDFCFGLMVDGWPTEADEWVTRQRKYNWPQKDLIEKVRSLDCHLVPVGDKTSQNSRLEWRLSFLLCERELVWNFNDIQIQLYFLLKELLKSELEQLYPDQLSSYCVKTAVFWYSESHDPSKWNDTNLLGLVKDCLLYLLSCIENGELQHYFDRRRNLLFSKFTDNKRKHVVIEKITEISENVILGIINLLNQEDVSKAWSKSNGEPKEFIHLCDDLEFLVSSFHKHRYQHDQLSTYQCLLGVFLSIVTSNKVEELWSRWIYIKTHNCDDIDGDFFNLVRKFIEIRIRVCITEMQKMASEDDYKRKLKWAETGIVNAIDIDRISGYLYLATFYLYIDKANMVIDTVTRILKTNDGTSLIYPGQCSMKGGIGMSSSKMLVQTDCPFLKGDIRLSAFVGFDMMFSASNLQFVPYPVKYECALVQQYPEGCIMIHPVIYAYFILTFSLYDPECVQKSRAYLEKLKIAVTEAKGGCQHFRALNLLGYCYLLFERFDLAYKCFEDSLKETAGHYRNAAIYHMIILIFDLIEMHVTILYER
ncbi:Hypothetical predicted protein [Mytilus galloprovincialis]|uniref:Mab-21-like HhH/H2TH-like domain-containing protein n=1 Tax=Mytilus galloprovincialis TaxID=29158 RepID=A0A8B6ECN8_MYTGA|nr:Hypothetical predicted protein [Mytilus galloprovincialis]